MKYKDSCVLESVWKAKFRRGQKIEALRFQGLLLSKMVEAAGIEPASDPLVLADEVKSTLYMFLHPQNPNTSEDGFLLPFTIP